MEQYAKKKPTERTCYPHQADVGRHKWRFFNCYEISQSNRDAMAEYLLRYEALSCGKTKRIRKILSNMKTILTIVAPGFDLKTATEDDFILLAGKINASGYMARTRADFFTVIKGYYRVVEGRGKRLPEKLDFFNFREKIPPSKGVDDCITREEQSKLLAAALNYRDSALISLLCEGGLRAGEVHALDVKSVVFEEDGLMVNIPAKPECKTGARTVPLQECYRHMKSWYDTHPDRSNPDAPFFTTLQVYKGEQYQRLTGDDIRIIVKRCAERAFFPNHYRRLRSRTLSKEEKSRIFAELKTGLKKFHPHAFRHTACTEKACLGMSETQHCAFFGHGFEQAKVYVHLSGPQIKQSYKRLLGVEESVEKLRKTCHKCGYVNAFMSGNCGRCGSPLDAKAKLEMDSAKDLALSMWGAILRLDPQARQAVNDAAERHKDELQEIAQRITAGGSLEKSRALKLPV